MATNHYPTPPTLLTSQVLLVVSSFAMLSFFFHLSALAAVVALCCVGFLPSGTELVSVQRFVLLYCSEEYFIQLCFMDFSGTED